ncbi:ATP-binding cassette domain-containing protein [Glutamicibacter sp. NPDC087344]|uniref:ATP-binding cassette domain-containing protein n=1 Tax=Glutamicibacter sp. NPDC087344 TaxID=3363994 RepID=UPI00382A552A
MSKHYGKAHILKDISCSIPAGQITGLLGPNGSGKSTLMRMILGLGTPDSGTILFDGVQYADLPNPGARIGSLLDAAARHPGRNVRDSFSLAAGMLGVSNGRRDEVIEQMGLGSVTKRRFKSLSLGMRQRVGLGIAILGRPQCLILDEPVNGLDIESISWLRGLLTKYAQDGGSVLVSSHLLQELQSYAHRVVIIDRGSIATESALSDLNNPNEQVNVEADEPERLAALLRAHGYSVADHAAPGWLKVQASNRQVAQLAMEHRILITSLGAQQEHQLEEAYLRLTQGEYSVDRTEVIDL